jgi:uncharacterized radical SAM superfamily protein
MNIFRLLKSQNLNQEVNMIKKINIVIIFFTAISFSFGQVPRDVKDVVRDILLRNNPLSEINSIPLPENASHIILLERIKIKDVEMSIYKFGWNITDLPGNYILIVDGPQSNWKVFGSRSLQEDLVGIKRYFEHDKGFKESTKLTCYNYLIDNYRW